MRASGTKEKIIVEGQALLQQHGYNGFSFQDIADKLGIKKPSLYDHFASKDRLILAILENYSGKFEKWAQKVAEDPPLERVRKVFDVFHAFSSDKCKVCPVLALVTDLRSLSKETQNGIDAFLERWLKWLEAQIKEGQRSGEIRKDIPAKRLASAIYSQAMGAQFQARIKGDPKLTLSSGEFIVSVLKPCRTRK